MLKRALLGGLAALRRFSTDPLLCSESLLMSATWIVLSTLEARVADIASSSKWAEMRDDKIQLLRRRGLLRRQTKEKVVIKTGWESASQVGKVEATEGVRVIQRGGDERE